MQSVKVIRVITRLNIGGPSRQAILLTEAFNQNGSESQLVSGTVSQREGDLHDEVLQRGIPFHQVHELGRELSIGKDLVSFWKLLRLFLRERPQIVHTHMAKAGTLGRLAAFCAGVPIRVHTYHGHVFHDYFSRPKSYLFLTVERALAPFSQCLIAVSETVREELCDRYRIGSSETMRVIPLGLDIEPLLSSERNKGTLRRELGLGETTQLVGIVGRLVPVKDHLFFLSIALELSKRRRDVRFVIVGDGELQEELKAAVLRMGLEAKVTFLGWRKDLEKIYPDLDVVLLTSRNEGTPVSLIEAMASARPVVTTRVGGTPDLIREGETGYCISHGDGEAFCEKIELLLDNGNLRKLMGERGRKWVRERYSKERLIADIKKLYGELIEKYCKRRVN